MRKFKEEISRFGSVLHQKNMLAAADGNISVRVDANKVLITSAGVAKWDLETNNFAIINLDGEILEGGSPSSESSMHLAVYRNCEKTKAIIHAHPPTAIAYTIAFPDSLELPGNCFSELILAAGTVPIVPYARPGSIEMGSNLLPYLPDHRVMILARHGALCWGENLSEAYFGMDRLEHSAQILLKAKAFGGITELSKDEVAELKKLRAKIGEKTL